MRALIYQSSYQDALFRRNYMSAVFAWMALGLGITGGVATWVLSVPVIREVMMSNRELFVALFVTELFLVWGMTLRVERMSPSGTVFTLLCYAVLNGITWSALFFLFAGESVALVFYISALTFAAGGLYGFLTSKDMSRPGNIWGLLWVGMAMTLLCNFILSRGGFYWIISFAGILIFTCLTVSDVRQIKVMGDRAVLDGQPCFKSVVQGALILYLDFMNLILFFFRIWGGRRPGS